MQEKLIPRLTFNPGQEPGLALIAEQPGPVIARKNHRVKLDRNSSLRSEQCPQPLLQVS